MEKLIKLKMRILAHSFLLMFLGIIIFTLVDFGPLLLGWVYGSVLSILSFLLLSRTMEKAVTYTPGKAKVYTILNYLLRYVLLFVALLVAIKRPDMHIITVVLGLMIPKTVILYYDLGVYSLRRRSSYPPENE